MKVFLVLGCNGYEEDGFSLCGRIKNYILDISTNTEQNIKISEHLEKIGLFDQPIYKNARTILYTLQNKFSFKGPVFSERKFKLMEHFCIMHKQCQVYLAVEILP